MKFTLPILLLIVAPCFVSADVIISEDFEDSTLQYDQSGAINVPGGTVPIMNLADNTLLAGGGNDENYFGRVNNASVEANYNLISDNGSFFYGAQNTSGDTTSQPDVVTLEFAGIDISNFQNLSFGGLFASFDNMTNGVGQFDSNTSVRIQAEIDNGGFFNVLAFESVNNSQDDRQVRGDSDFDGAGDLGGILLTDTFQSVSAGIAGTGNLLDVRIIIDSLNSEGEDIAFDNITIEGDEISAVPEPASFLLFGSALGACVLPRRRKSLFSFLSKS